MIWEFWFGRNAVMAKVDALTKEDAISEFKRIFGDVHYVIGNE